MVHTIACCLEILVAVLGKLVRCVQIESVVAFLLGKMLATVIQGRVLRNRPTLERCLMGAMWQHTTELAYVLMCWLHIIASSNVLHALERELEVPTGNQGAHILQPNWRLMHALLIILFQYAVQPLNLVILIFQLA